MSAANFVTVTITTATQLPTQVGFGTPLVLGYHTAWPDRIRAYENLTDLAADGITSTGVGAGIYWAAAAMLSQNPRVKQFKVGRRTNPFTQRVDLIVTDATAGVVYKATLGAIGTVGTQITRTVPGASTIAAEAAAIKALIDALGLGFTTSLQTTNVANDTIRCTANTPGQMFVFAARNVALQIFDNTLAPAAISTDLDACRVADDDWYAIHLDSSSKAECLVVAAWTEPQFKIFFASTSDTENGTVGASNTLLKQLKTASYKRTSTWVDTAVCPSFLGAGILGEELPFDPGTQAGTYKGKTVSGVTVDSLSTTFENEVVAQNGNVYTTVMGKNVTREGVVAFGEFIDVIVGRDWLTARIKESAFGIETSGRRVPYTNGGASTLKGGMIGVLKRAQGTVQKPGFLDPEVDPVVTCPLVADMDPTLRAQRRFGPITFSAKIAGAIHLADFEGTLTT